MTISINGAAATTVSFTGRFHLTADPSANNGAIAGVLDVTDTHTPGSSPASNLHFNIDGTLSDGTFTIDRLSVAQATDSSTLTVFRSPVSADATKITLASA